MPTYMNIYLPSFGGAGEQYWFQNHVFSTKKKNYKKELCELNEFLIMIAKIMNIFAFYSSQKSPFFPIIWNFHYYIWSLAGYVHSYPHHSVYALYYIQQFTTYITTLRFFSIIYNIYRWVHYSIDRERIAKIGTFIVIIYRNQILRTLVNMWMNVTGNWILVLRGGSMSRSVMYAMVPIYIMIMVFCVILHGGFLIKM